ncbi:hypothetical protein ACXR2T_10605 [Leucobacter sp. HY1910]
MIEHWRAYVLPDMARFYPSLGDPLGAAWRDVREVILSLFGIPESLTGATFARAQSEEDT